MKYIKSIPWLIVIIAVAWVAIYYYRHSKALEELASIKNQELMEAKLEIGRAKTIIGNANTLINKLEKNIQKEIKERKAIVSLYAELQATYLAERENVRTITKVIYKEKNTDRVINLPKNRIFIRQKDGTYNEITSMVYNYKDFRITIKGDAIKQTLSYKLHQKFRGQFIESKVPGGAINHYVKIYEVDDKGKDIGELKLEKFEVIKSKELQNRMMWWNPKLDINIGGGLNSKLKGFYTAEFGFSTSAYGKTSDDLTWRFIRLGTGITNHGFSLTLSPAQINLGKFLPVISNMWVVPFAGYDFGSFAGIFGIGIGLVF